MIHTIIRKDPEDANYEETMPNARVWGTYEHEPQENVAYCLLVFVSL